MLPSQFQPTFADLIGSAHSAGHILQRKIATLRPDTDTAKNLFCGAPGVAKSTLARLCAELLIGHPRCRPGRSMPSPEWTCSVEEKSGADLNVETIRAWQSRLGLTSLFSEWRIVIVEELDACPAVAQTLLLDFLDKLPAGFAFFGTSNLQLHLLQERFQTRMKVWKIQPPTTEEIVHFLTQRWKIPAQVAAQIAVASGGNVRAACLDAESYLDTQLAA